MGSAEGRGLPRPSGQCEAISAKPLFASAPFDPMWGRRAAQLYNGPVLRCSQLHRLMVQSEEKGRTETRPYDPFGYPLLTVGSGLSTSQWCHPEESVPQDDEGSQQLPDT